MSAEIKYNEYGRMQYHPDYHGNNGLPWSGVDERYLIDNYLKLGPEEVSLALERTIDSVMRKMYKLRKLGLVDAGHKRTYRRRLRNID